MTAYGYIRKSVVHDVARMLSPAMQRESIMRLAEHNGDDHVEILEDLDVSGRKRRSQRPQWDELLQAVEDGEAHAVYAYSLSRFARSVSQLSEFFDLCKEHDVRIGVDKDHIDTSTATGTLMTNMLASLAQFEADVASERVKDAFAVKRANDPSWVGPGIRKYGSLPGEDPQAVVDAFREATSFDGAARLLHERGVPTRLKGAVWSGSTVALLVRRHAPDEVAPAIRRGASAGAGTFRFSQLIICSECGKPLTGSRDQRTGEARYSCGRARVMAHGRGWINESKLLPVIIDEANRAHLMSKRLRKGSAKDEEALEALDAKRTRVIDMYAEGIIDKPERDARLTQIASDESGYAVRRWVRRYAIPPDIAAEDASTVNAYLRRLFESITVDMSQPAKRGPSKWLPTLTFEWRDPSLRVEDAGD